MMIKLYYSKEVESLLAEGRISKEKIEEIVELAEASGDRIFESATGWFVGKKMKKTGLIGSTITLMKMATRW